MTRRNARGEQLSPYAALAAESGLAPVGARDALGAYTKDLWSRRSFMWTLARSRSYQRNQDNYLGQLWNVLNPLLLAATYVFIFGVVLGTTGGVSNYPAFVVIGIMTYGYITGVMTVGASSIVSNMGIVRALRFPRAVLPISAALASLVSLVPEIVVMVVIVLVSGEPVRWTWLTLIPAVLVMSVFNAGVGMLLARIVSSARDLRNLIPVAIRLLRYVSGVFFSISHYVGDGTFGKLMTYQPVAVYMTLARSALMGEFHASLGLWAVAVMWAIVFFVVGYLVFWRAEETYGRD